MAYSETFVPCAAGAWTKVATAKTSGSVNIGLVPVSRPLFASVATGEDPPEGAIMGRPFIGEQMAIECMVPIDVYIWAVGSALSVRVDSV